MLTRSTLRLSQRDAERQFPGRLIQQHGDLLHELIFAPLEMNATAMNYPRDIVPHRAAGYRWQNDKLVNKPYYSPSVTYSAGGQISSVEDLVKWEQALERATLLKQSTLNS